MLGKVANSLLSVVYPQQCKNCRNLIKDHFDGVSCSACWSATRFFSGLETLCVKCGAFLRDTEPLIEARCQYCDDHHYDTARAAGIYHNAIAAAIIHLKSSPNLSRRIRRELSLSFNFWFTNKPTLLMPVPLSRQRAKERGFNQAAIIAASVSKDLGIPLDQQSLIRKFHTPVHRVAMDAKARDMSVRRAFDVKRKIFIEGQRVVLIDDVFTTGATASHCARALKKNGAARVDVYTLGRTVSGNIIASLKERRS